jgi:hypothetical protein
MKILFRAYFHQKNFQKKVGRKFIRVRIRIRIRTFSKVGSGSGQKSSGSATLFLSSQYIDILHVYSKVFLSRHLGHLADLSQPVWKSWEVTFWIYRPQGRFQRSLIIKLGFVGHSAPQKWTEVTLSKGGSRGPKGHSTKGKKLLCHWSDGEVSEATLTRASFPHHLTDGKISKVTRKKASPWDHLKMYDTSEVHSAEAEILRVLYTRSERRVWRSPNWNKFLQNHSAQSSSKNFLAEWEPLPEDFVLKGLTVNDHGIAVSWHWVRAPTHLV